MKHVSLLLACASLTLSAATAPYFPRLYNIEGGQTSSVRAYCGDGLKVLGGGCGAITDNWVWGASFPEEEYWNCGWHGSTKRVRMTCVDAAYAPIRKSREEQGQWATATCDPGQKAIGGGCDSKWQNVYPYDMPEGDNAWKCGGNNLGEMKAFVLCVPDSVEIQIKEAQGGSDVSVQCDAGFQAVSGGCEAQHHYKIALNWPTEDRRSWRCEGHGTNKRVKAICVRTTTTTTTRIAYRFYRFTVKKVHGTNIAFSEIELGLTDSDGMTGKVVNNNGVTAFALGAKMPDDSSEGASKLVDGDWHTKYYDSFMAPVVLDMQSPIAADSFRWVTNNEYWQDDPLQWFFDGSADNIEWETLHNDTSSTSSSRDRNSATEWFTFATGERTYRFFRFSVIRRRQDDDFQVADFRFRVAGSEVSLSGVSVSSTASPAHENEDASKVLDNNQNTKFVTLGAANVQLTFDLKSNMALEEFGFVTGDDYPGRDPKKWMMEGSTDATTWALLNQQLIPMRGSNEFDRHMFVGWLPMRTHDSLRYLMLSSASSECPFNYSPLTRDECEFASSAAGNPLNGLGLAWHVSNKVDTKTCFNTDDSIFFNSHPDAAGREWRHLICKATSTTTTTTTTSTTTTTTTTMFYSIINRHYNFSLTPKPNKKRADDTCSNSGTGVWKISVISANTPTVVTLEVDILGDQRWQFLGHVGRELVISGFGGPSFTWRLVSLGNDLYTLQNTVENNFGNRYLALNQTESQLESSADNERTQWRLMEGLPPPPPAAQQPEKRRLGGLP